MVLAMLVKKLPGTHGQQAFVGTMFLLTACWQNNQYQLSKGKDHTGAGVPPEIQKYRDEQRRVIRDDVISKYGDLMEPVAKK